jgi:hypothetical protein
MDDKERVAPVGPSPVKNGIPTMRFEDGGAFLRLNTMALVGMSKAGKAMGDQDSKRAVEVIVRESASVLDTYADGSGLAFQLSTNLAAAKG